MPTDRYVEALDNHFPNVSKNYPIDVSIERKSWVTLYPTNHDNNFLKDSFVEFTIDSEPGCFIDYSSFNIEFNLQLLKENGDALPHDSSVIFTNGLIHTLIISRKLFLNSQLVESDYQSNYTQYVDTITSKDNEYIKNQGVAIGYFPEQKIINSTPDKATFTGQDGYISDRWLYIRQKFARQENIQLYGALNLCVGKSDMLMIDGISARLHIELAETSQLILKALDDEDDYKIKIFSVKLHLKRITPVEKAYSEFNKRLLTKNIQYNFKRFIQYKSTVGANQRQVFLSQPFGSLIPSKMHILMVSQSGCIGDTNKNAQYFDHFKLDNLKITANGLSVMDFELNFPNKYTSLYKRVIDSLNSNRHSISHSKFGSGATIITADCKNSENNSFMQIEKHGHLEIHVRFSEALPEPINIIIIGVTAGSIEVDYDRRVSTHYNF